MRSILAVLLLAVFSLMASFRLMATMMVHQNATVTLAKQYCPATWPSDGASCSMVGDVSRTFVAEETRIVSKSGQEWFIAPTTPALLFMLHPYTLAGLIGCFEESPESVFIDGKFAGTKLDLRVVSRVFNEAIAAATSLMESKGVGEQSKKTALLRLQTVRNDMLTGINVAKKYAII